MKESDYYPAGAYNDPSAPWNDPADQDEREFDVLVSQSLSKNTTVYTSDYIDIVDVEYDDGNCFAAKDVDTSNVNWIEAYHDSCRTPLEIIQAADKLATALIEEGRKKIAGISLDEFVEDCKDWTEDDLEVIED